MSQELQIRPIPPDGLDALLALYGHLHEQDAPLPARTEVDAVWRGIQDDPHLICLGGYVAQELVASCTMAIIPNLTRGLRPYGLIENVVTHANHRRRGHGRSLLAHALSLAWSRSCYKVMLMTGRLDEATLRFYEAAGFDRHAKQAFVARPASSAV